MVYIPSLVIINDEAVGYDVDAMRFSVVLFFCFSIQVVASKIPCFYFNNVNVRITLLRPETIVKLIALPVCAVIFYRVASNFSIVSILDVYGKRDAVQLLDLGFVRYLIAWLSNFILPVVIAGGVLNKNYNIVFFCVAAYVFLFFTLGAKLYLLALSYFILSYGYLNWCKKGDYFLPLIFSIMLIFPLVLIGERLEGIKYIYEGLINVRVFLIQGLAAPVYVEFFSNNGYTYFSHISIISSFIDNPYTEAIPVVLNAEYKLGNFNAPFYYSDGYTSYGLVGMLIMSFIVSAFFYVMDSICKKHDHQYVILSLSVFVVSFSNASFATSLTTFGAVLFFLYYLFARKEMVEVRFL
jgi:hypothetical protein